MDIRKAHYTRDFTPLYGTFTRAYVNHLFRAGEMLGPLIGSMHNIKFITTLIANIRQSIIDDTFDTFRTSFMARYNA